MSNWSKLFKKYSLLDFRSKKLYFKTFIWLLFLKIHLKLLPFSWFKKLYQFIGLFVFKMKATEEETKIMIHRLTTSKIQFTCLIQALVYKLFFFNNPDYQIVIGVNTQTTDFLAHAWVEKGGAWKIGDNVLEQYTPLWQWK